MMKGKSFGIFLLGMVNIFNCPQSQNRLIEGIIQGSTMMKTQVLYFLTPVPCPEDWEPCPWESGTTANSNKSHLLSFHTWISITSYHKASQCQMSWASKKYHLFIWGLVTALGPCLQHTQWTKQVSLPAGFAGLSSSACWQVHAQPGEADPSLASSFLYSFIQLRLHSKSPQF